MNWFKNNTNIKLLIILLCVVLLIVSVYRMCTREYMTGNKPGDECSDEDKEEVKVTGGKTYEYNDDKECVVTECVTGYNLSGDTCLITAPAGGTTPSAAGDGASPPPPANVKGNILDIRGVLNTNEELRSENGQYRLVMEGDGNLVLYKIEGSIPLWNSNTAGNRPGNRVVMQGDGNLVIYKPGEMSAANAAWASNTANNQPGNRLVLQNDGNLVIYKPGEMRATNAVWASNTAVVQQQAAAVVRNASTVVSDTVNTFAAAQQQAAASLKRTF